MYSLELNVSILDEGEKKSSQRRRLKGYEGSGFLFHYRKPYSGRKAHRVPRRCLYRVGSIRTSRDNEKVLWYRIVIDTSPEDKNLSKKV